jgi:hypothetical protein
MDISRIRTNSKFGLAVRVNHKSNQDRLHVPSIPAWKCLLPKHYRFTILPGGRSRTSMCYAAPRSAGPAHPCALRNGGARSAVRRTGRQLLLHCRHTSHPCDQGQDARVKSCPRYQTCKPGDFSSHRVFYCLVVFKATVVFTRLV